MTGRPNKGLSPAQARIAATAAEAVLSGLETQPIPTLRHAFGPELEAVSCANIAGIRAAAQPAWQGDVGGDDAVSSVQFLLALEAIALRAASPGRHLLFYRPQP
jgi:hypothetical protein